MNNKIIHAKEQFFLNANGLLDEKSSTNPKSFWTLVKSIMGRSRSTTIPPLIDSISDELVTDDLSKANLLNRHFCSISSVNDRNINVPDLPSKTQQSLDIDEITVAEIKDILDSLKLGKASGNDGISHHMLKFSSRTVSYPLSIIFNKSIRTQKFPSCWKLASVLAFYKKGDKTSPVNYRPIALLSCLGKVFERVIFKHIHNYLLENRLLYKYQSGFMPGHSTYHQLIEIYHKICLSLEKRGSFLYCVLRHIESI